MHNTHIWFAEGPSKFTHSMYGGRGFDGFGMHDLGPQSLLSFSLLALCAVLALAWVIGIKGYALWTAAQRKEKWWFIALLIINTFGLLEIVYLMFFAKKFAMGKLSNTSDRDGKPTVEASAQASTSTTETVRTTEHHSHSAHPHHSEHKTGIEQEKGEEGK